MKLNKAMAAVSITAAMACLALAVATLMSMRPVPASLAEVAAGPPRVALLDRDGRRLMETGGQWNRYDTMPLHEIPLFMRMAVVVSEDKRFFEHNGVDWIARGHAVVQTIQHMRAVRGASTISEQVVKMIHPRPRTAWTRWVEGFEAMELERKVSKEEILEFWLNQAPYASNHRGIVQAASYYFDRSPQTLSKQEMIALAVLPRRPSGYDLYRGQERIQGLMEKLAEALIRNGHLTLEEADMMKGSPMKLARPESGVDTYHFNQYAASLLRERGISNGAVMTTLDLPLQADLAGLLDERMKALAPLGARNAAMLVADHATGEILAWVVHGDIGKADPGSFYNAVLEPRQPGSVLKPFLYAMALENGWTAATILNDNPLDTATGAGVHTFHNYSKVFYGPLTLRECLANSLNIPAVLTLRHVGQEKYLGFLRDSGFSGLSMPADYYGDALALGAAEVTLYQMVQAYTALANRGVMIPLRIFPGQGERRQGGRLFSAETASIVGDILSDPYARRLEFPSAGAMSLPHRTAIKTGTSTDFHDAWTAAYNGRHVVGVWIGALSSRPMDGITGASGPAALLGSVFARLGRDHEPGDLFMSPNLQSAMIIQEGDAVRLAGEGELGRMELFAPGTLALEWNISTAQEAKLAFPHNNLVAAMDPRIPPASQSMEFRVEGAPAGGLVEWRLDGAFLGRSDNGRYLWPLVKGVHRLEASALWEDGAVAHKLGPVVFHVR